MDKLESAVAVILAVLFIVAVSVYGATMPKYGEEDTKKAKWNTFFGWVLTYVRIAILIAPILILIILLISFLVQKR